jgi:ketosteroid isomerase-like protein
MSTANLRGVGAEAAPAVIHRYFELMNGDRWDVFGELWAEDARHMAVGAGWRQGREAIVDFYSRLFRAWTFHDDEPTRFFVAPEATTVEVTFHGTMEDGRKLDMEAVDVIYVENGEITQLTNWYDIGWLRKELSTPKS